MMSRYGYFIEGYENVSVIGWDPPMKTYFAQISPNNNIDPDDRPTKCWIGSRHAECQTVEDLDRRLKAIGLPGLPKREHPWTNKDLWEQLRRDRD